MGERIEQRRDLRHGLQMPAKLKFRDRGTRAGSELHLVTKDISASGAFLEGSAGIEVGAEMEVKLEIPLEMLRNVTSRVASLTLNGKVIRVSERGFAISFADGGDLDFLKNAEKA